MQRLKPRGSEPRPRDTLAENRGLTNFCWMPSPRPVSLKIPRLAEVAQPPATAHLLLRECRRALRQRRPRVAILEAATATEIVLTDKIETSLVLLPSQASEAILRQLNGLSRKVEMLKGLGVSSPPRDEEGSHRAAQRCRTQG
jgi:hypothetical protein